MLFNVVYSVFEDWHHQCSQAGVSFVIPMVTNWLDIIQLNLVWYHITESMFVNDDQKYFIIDDFGGLWTSVVEDHPSFKQLAVDFGMSDGVGTVCYWCSVVYTDLVLWQG